MQAEHEPRRPRKIRDGPWPLWGLASVPAIVITMAIALDDGSETQGQPQPRPTPEASTVADPAEATSKPASTSKPATTSAPETEASPLLVATAALEETLRDRYVASDPFCELRGDNSRTHFQCAVGNGSGDGVILALWLNCSRPITTDTSGCTMREMTFLERCQTGEINTDSEIKRCGRLGYEYAG